MRFDDRFLDEIKTRLRLSDVIGKSVRLKRQGREYVGLSPFTKEKSPSFFVNDDKGFYHDFSSGKHGDLIDFLVETERLSFREAVERLAGEAGVPLPAADPRAAEQEQKRQGLQEWLEAAAKWFEQQLRRQVGEGARAYLAKRALPEGEWPRFRLGYAPSSRTALKDFLVAKGARPAELVDAGLLIAPEGGGAPYDRFRDRIIFPITDARGRVVSFGGRALNPDDRAKYLNGPETALFHKGAQLYGLQEARKLLAAGGEHATLVVVEGYMDVVACQRAGVAAVAPLGTALTEEQMALLWRHHPEPTLAFDGDAAGIRAAHRSMDRALTLLQPGRSFRFVFFSEGRDPDDVLREQGPGALKAALAQTKPFVEVLFERERDAASLTNPEGKAGLKQRLRHLASAVQDKDLADAYRQDLLGRYGALFPAPEWKPRADRPFRRFRADGPDPSAPPTSEGKAAARRLSDALDPAAAAVAQGAVDDPARLDDYLETLQAYGFGDPVFADLANEIIRLRLSADSLDSEGVKRHLAARGHGPLLGETAKAARKSGAPFLDPASPPEQARALWSQAFEVLTRMAALETALSQAKAGLVQGGEASSLMRLKAERDALKRAIKTGTLWAAEVSLTRDPPGRP